MANEMTKYSDEELVSLAGKRGRKGARAFEMLYDKNSNNIYKYCRKILGNDELARDALQETFLRLYQALQKKSDMPNFQAYLFRIARNYCLTLKSNKYSSTLTIENLTLESDQEDYGERELLSLVKTAVECLPPDYREPFVLREYDELSYAVIAEVLDIPISTVKIRIYRAKQKLRKELKPYLNDISIR